MVAVLSLARRMMDVSGRPLTSMAADLDIYEGGRYDGRLSDMFETQEQIHESRIAFAGQPSGDTYTGTQFDSNVAPSVVSTSRAQTATMGLRSDPSVFRGTRGSGDGALDLLGELRKNDARSVVDHGASALLSRSARREDRRKRYELKEQRRVERRRRRNDRRYRRHRHRGDSSRMPSTVSSNMALTDCTHEKRAMGLRERLEPLTFDETVRDIFDSIPHLKDDLEAVFAVIDARIPLDLSKVDTPGLRERLESLARKAGMINEDETPAKFTFPKSAILAKPNFTRSLDAAVTVARERTRRMEAEAEYADPSRGIPLRGWRGPRGISPPRLKQRNARPTPMPTLEPIPKMSRIEQLGGIKEYHELDAVQEAMDNPFMSYRPPTPTPIQHDPFAEFYKQEIENAVARGEGFPTPAPVLASSVSQGGEFVKGGRENSGLLKRPGGKAKRKEISMRLIREMNQAERIDEVERVIEVKDDAFEALQVWEDDSDEYVRKSYRRLSLILHPDKCMHPKAAEAMKKIQYSLSVLSDVKMRSKLMTTRAKSAHMHRTSEFMQRISTKKSSSDGPGTQVLEYIRQQRTKYARGTAILESEGIETGGAQLARVRMEEARENVGGRRSLDPQVKYSDDSYFIRERMAEKLLDSSVNKTAELGVVDFTSLKDSQKILECSAEEKVQDTSIFDGFLQQTTKTRREVFEANKRRVLKEHVQVDHRKTRRKR